MPEARPVETALVVDVWMGSEGADGSRLGWLTWANTAGMDRDPADTLLLM